MRAWMGDIFKIKVIRIYAIVLLLGLLTALAVRVGLSLYGVHIGGHIYIKHRI